MKYPEFLFLLTLIILQRIIEKKLSKGKAKILPLKFYRDKTFILMLLAWASTFGIATLEYLNDPKNIILFFIGIVIFIIGSIFRILSISQLKEIFSPLIEPSENNKLIVRGIYRFTRHPAYIGSLLISLGIIFILRGYNALLPYFLLYVPALIYRIRKEEETLINKFGESYIEYMRNVKRFFIF